MIAGLDTNILAYAEGVNDRQHQRGALSLIERLPLDEVLVPVQVLGELFRVLTLKRKLPPAEARASVLRWQDAFTTCETTARAFKSAMDLAADHHLSIWDALILSVVAENGCRYLFSEDMLNGFVWQGVTVINPFAESSADILKAYFP